MGRVDTRERHRSANRRPGAVGRQAGNDGATRLELAPERERVALRRAPVQPGDARGGAGVDGPDADSVQRRAASVVDLDVDHRRVGSRKVIAVVVQLVEEHVR